MVWILIEQGDNGQMRTRTQKLAAIVAVAAALVGLGTSQAFAVNPNSFIRFFPAHDLLEATQNAKRVRFFAEVLSDKVGIDVVSITPNTKGSIQAFAKCLGQDTNIVEEEFDSPLSVLDDAIVFCPVFSRGEVLQAGVGIYPLPN